MKSKRIRSVWGELRKMSVFTNPIWIDKVNFFIPIQPSCFIAFWSVVFGPVAFGPVAFSPAGTHHPSGRGSVWVLTCRKTMAPKSVDRFQTLTGYCFYKAASRQVIEELSF
jgi:hypothetical protein